MKTNQIKRNNFRLSFAHAEWFQTGCCVWMEEESISVVNNVMQVNNSENEDIIFQIDTHIQRYKYLISQLFLMNATKYK